MNSPIPNSPPIDPLQELQKTFCLIVMDSQIRIGDQREIAAIKQGTRTEDINMFKQSDGKLEMRRCLENLPVSCKPNEVIEAFLTNPNTLRYDTVAFTPLPTPATTINYWVPPSVQPQSGDPSKIGKFLKQVICNRHKESWSYLLPFLAHMWHKPEEKPGVAIVLLGGQGTGKGTFFQLLANIWTKTTLQVSSVEHIVGGFNAAMERNFIINMDEALFSGDRRAMDKLKSMITEPTITIEQKYQPRRTVGSIHRFFAASNHQHFGNIEKDDRRFVFLRVSEERKGDHNYFGEIHSAISDPFQLAAFVELLKTLPIADFNVRSKPNTSELIQQKLQSLRGFERFWYEVLCTGNLDFPDQYISQSWQESMFISTKRLAAAYEKHALKYRQYDSIQSAEINKGLAIWCPDARQDRKQINNEQQRGYQLPHIDLAKENFEEAIGGKVDW